MSNFTIYLAAFLCLFASKILGQETFETKAKNIASKIEAITKEEKAALKTEVEAVNKQLEKGIITFAEAENKKKILAEARAINIESRVAKEQENLKDLVQEKVDGKLSESDTIKKPNQLILKWEKGDKGYVPKTINEKRTTSQFVFAAGLNNLIVEDKLQDSDYSFIGSHFYEWGITSNTRLFKNHNLLHAKYGFSVMYNNLRPTDNRNFVVNGEQTDLISNPIHLKDSRFRNVYLVAPVHLEFDFSGSETKESKQYFKSHQSFRFGIGGYAGINLKSKQIIKYEDNDLKATQKTKGDFNTTNFIYGLSSYIGYKETSLYVKYDLNPLFKNNTIDQNNISMGIRFDFN
jgi:hypothetical protein